MSDGEPIPLLVDANVLVRLFTDDPPQQAARAERWLDAVRDGSMTAIVEDVIVAEVVWVLRSFYHTPRDVIQAALTRVLDLPGVLHADKATLRRALALYGASNFDFAEALLAARALTRGHTVLSFDRDFDRVSGVTRREPI